MARVRIVDQNSGKIYHVQLPANVKTAQVLPALVKVFKLPTEGAGGEPLQYDLMLETEQGKVRLGDEDILAEAGVVDGAVIRITPHMTPGRRPTALQAFRKMKHSIDELSLRIELLERELKAYMEHEETLSEASISSINPEKGGEHSASATSIVWLKVQQPSFGEDEKRALINMIAEKTGVSPDQIKILDIIPENSMVTVELPDAAAANLLVSYITADPELMKLGILKVEVRYGPKDSRTPLLEARASSPLIDYQLGLNRLGQAIVNETQDQQVLFHTLEARLLDYLENERRFGVSETVKEEKSRVLYALNDFVIRFGLGISFTDLCQDKPPARAVLGPGI